MSVEELRARIVRLNSEIELQKNLLEKLENDKFFSLRQLNAALDPVARLPLEISSEIFLRYLTWGAQHVPTLLLNICNAWTDIALATPSLWTTVHIDFPCEDDFAAMLLLWFQRARNRPFSISISLRGCAANWNHYVSDVLWSHGGQLKHLELLDEGDDFVSGDGAIDLFGDTTPVSLPLLETLTIRCQHEQRTYSSSQILKLLRAPCIVETTLHNMALNNHWHRSEILVIPTLRRLIFPEDSAEDSIFRHLSLPALETLSLPMYDISYTELFAFVEQSAAPLQDLVLGCQFVATPPLRDCLCLIPTLTRFKMWEPDMDMVADLFDALAADSSLLPNLRDLTIHIDIGDESDIPDFSWRSLVRAFSTRRMEQFYIVPVVVSPPTDVLASLRELAAAGSKMHVGVEDWNFVLA
ncbi:hypothetical protein C8R45DRAFT_1007511 [Mycena sanguinolenta]|nr:hypothetical protein C8R45DRAFT_1007511 [Mycena sanguinolenta]